MLCIVCWQEPGRNVHVHPVQCRASSMRFRRRDSFFSCGQEGRSDTYPSAYTVPGAITPPCPGAGIMLRTFWEWLRIRARADASFALSALVSRKGAENTYRHARERLLHPLSRESCDAQMRLSGRGTRRWRARWRGVATGAMLTRPKSNRSLPRTERVYHRLVPRGSGP
jgi:hypothetical protein